MKAPVPRVCFHPSASKRASCGLVASIFSSLARGVRAYAGNSGNSLLCCQRSLEFVYVQHINGPPGRCPATAGTGGITAIDADAVPHSDRKRGLSGKRVSVRVDIEGCGINKKKK